MEYSVFLVLIIFVCLLLTLVIMVQNPKGGGLSSTFGAGGNQLGGVQKTTDFLDKSTWTLGFVLLALILLSTFAFKSSNDSKLVDENAPISAPKPDAKPSEAPAKPVEAPAKNATPTK